MPLPVSAFIQLRIYTVIAYPELKLTCLLSSNTARIDHRWNVLSIGDSAARQTCSAQSTPSHFFGTLGSPVPIINRHDPQTSGNRIASRDQEIELTAIKQAVSSRWRKSKSPSGQHLLVLLSSNLWGSRLRVHEGCSPTCLLRAGLRLTNAGFEVPWRTKDLASLHNQAHP